MMPYVMVTYAYYPRAYAREWKVENEGFMPYKELIYVMFVKEMGPLNVLEDIGLKEPKFYGFVPFLFLDNAIPVACGREIFGMPKVMADLDYPTVGDTGPGQKFRASTLGFDKTNGKPSMAREQLIMEVTCPDNFSMEEILSQANGSPHDAISRELYRHVRTDSIDLNLSMKMIKIHEMEYLSMRQYRDPIDTERAMQKSIIKFPGGNLTVTKGGTLPGPFKIEYGKKQSYLPSPRSNGARKRGYYVLLVSMGF